MKILYIAMKYNPIFRDPTRGFSFEHYNFYDSLVKMENRKHEIIYFPFDEIMYEMGRDEMNRKLLQVVYQENPDLCFFILFTDEIKQETIKEITEKSGAVTFNWFADDHWRFDVYSKYWAPLFHWISTTDSQAPEKYQKIGYKNVIKTQWGCNHFLYKPLNIEKKYDITFVGQSHGNRKEIVEKIRRSSMHVKCWGSGWEGGRIPQEEMTRLFSESKVNLNLTASSGMWNPKTLFRGLASRRSDGIIVFDSFRKWFNNLSGLRRYRREQIKGRTFEIPGCGGFLLTASADNLSDYYEDVKEVVIFNNIDDLIQKLRYYLSHDKERKRIAHAGYQRTLRDHTYEKRFNEIFNNIFK